MAGGPYIKYTEFPGVVAERVITARDFEDNGAPGTPEIRFNRENRYMIDAGEMGLSEEAIQVFKNEPGFTVSESEKAPRLVGNTDDTPPARANASGEGSLGTAAAASGTGTAAATGGTAGGRR